MNCPLCGEILAERGFFCKACAGQVRCKACRELLEPAAAACVECGLRVGESRGDGTASLAPVPASVHRNTLTYAETKTNRSFQASLSDAAIEGLGEILGDFFVQRGSARGAVQPRRFVADPLSLQSPAPESAPSNGHPAVTTTGLNPEPISGDKDRVLKLFHVDGEALELKDNRLKAKSQSDFLRRLTYLFLYAHELQGRPLTAYDDLRKIHQVAKVWDANTRTWLAKRVGFTVDSENRFKLTAPGREDAIRALNEALNPDVQDEWNPDKKTPRKYAPRKKA